MPSEYLPTGLDATLLNPTVSSTSSTRLTDSPLETAIQRRCDRAERFGCTQLASSSAPTFVSGLIKAA